MVQRLQRDPDIWVPVMDADLVVVSEAVLGQALAGAEDTGEA